MYTPIPSLKVKCNGAHKHQPIEAFVWTAVCRTVPSSHQNLPYLNAVMEYPFKSYYPVHMNAPTVHS